MCYNFSFIIIYGLRIYSLIFCICELLMQLKVPWHEATSKKMNTSTHMNIQFQWYLGVHFLCASLMTLFFFWTEGRKFIESITIIQVRPTLQMVGMGGYWPQAHDTLECINSSQIWNIIGQIRKPQIRMNGK